MLALLVGSSVALAAAKQSVAKSVAVNRLARRNYELLDDYEAGIALTGTEVKSARAGHLNLRDGYVNIKEGSCWLQNVNIARHGTTGSYFQHDETRPRRLLLHKREILKLDQAVQQKGLTIVPISAYFNKDNRLKLKIALGRGKQVQDKRETIRRREEDRDIRRQTKNIQFG